MNEYAVQRLVSPLGLSLRLEDGCEQIIDGHYSIDAVAMKDLPDADVIALHRADALKMAGVVTASLAQIERLRQLHNGRFKNRIVSIDV